VNAPVLALEGVSKTYRSPDHDRRLVLDRIDLRVDEGEIIAILGKSGGGKSTLLRIIAGLVPSSDGQVIYRGDRLQGPSRGIAMVFQTFALFPWLTVFENVALGLEAQGVPRSERSERTLEAINLIGLDGFESAYPKELSGGMRQRVGFARALVLGPDLLLLDEPFSALDVLTAETLRGDLLELWDETRIPTKAIVLVSHNIEEAVSMADRIVILSSNPGRVRADIPVRLKHPRDDQSAPFRALVDEVYTLLASPDVDRLPHRRTRQKGIGIGYRLPDVSIQHLTGLIDTLASPPNNGRADLPNLGESAELKADQLLALADFLDLLGFARVVNGDMELAAAGFAFWDADIQRRKEIFAEHLLHRVPLATHIRRILAERENHSAPRERFLRELEDFLSDDEAARVLKTMINWGRYAELFAYDYHAEMLTLEDPMGEVQEA